jgi:hypothetical protein
MPSCNKGPKMYGPKMESSKQEKKNLMQDMPVVEKGMAMYGEKPGMGMYDEGMAMKGSVSWMSKHCKVK